MRSVWDEIRNLDRTVWDCHPFALDVFDVSDIEGMLDVFDVSDIEGIALSFPEPSGRLENATMMIRGSLLLVERDMPVRLDGYPEGLLIVNGVLNRLWEGE